jgi:hypothetical protein
MKTKIVYVPLDDERLTALAIMSDAPGLTVEELIQRAVNEFLDERRSK